METDLILKGSFKEMDALFECSKRISVRHYKPEGRNNYWNVTVRHSEDTNVAKAVKHATNIKRLITIDNTDTLELNSLIKSIRSIGWLNAIDNKYTLTPVFKGNTFANKVIITKSEFSEVKGRKDLMMILAASKILAGEV